MKHLTEQVKKAQRKQESTYNCGSKRIAPLSRGQAVRIGHRGIWEKGPMERQEGGKGRSYVVKLTAGGFYRRNRRDIWAARSDLLTSLSQEEVSGSNGGKALLNLRWLTLQPLQQAVLQS